MTNTWADIKNTNLVVIMGGNAAEAHPCGFKWVTEAKAHNKAKLIVVDPRFTRSAAVSDLYVPIRAGSDIAWLGGLINHLLTNDKIQHEYVKAYTNAAFIVKAGFGFSDGLFTGYDAQKRDYDRSSWAYEIGEDGYARVDETLQDPRCVFQLMKAHYTRYTAEMVERICGSPKDKLVQAWEWISETSAPDRVMTSMYALGWTQHSKGSQNIRTMAMVQLLLGNIGVAGGGMNALRGHSNIQGLTDLGLMSNLIPGYLTIPTEKETTLDAYMSTRGFNPLLSFPNRKKITTALSKLKFLVVMDPLQTETARFWENHGDFNNVDTASIQTEVIQLPSTCFAEDTGSLTNSGRQLHWHWAGGTPPGEAKHDTWIMAQIYTRLKALYQKEGGAFPDPLTKLVWPY